MNEFILILQILATSVGDNQLIVEYTKSEKDCLNIGYTVTQQSRNKVIYECIKSELILESKDVK